MSIGQLLKNIYIKIQLEDKKLSDTLKNIGISIYDYDLSIKDTYIILNAIADKWDSLKEKGSHSVINEYIAESIVGVRYKNEFIKLMEDWK